MKKHSLRKDEEIGRLGRLVVAVEGAHPFDVEDRLQQILSGGSHKDLQFVIDSSDRLSGVSEECSRPLARDFNMITSSGLYEPRDIVMLSAFSNVNLEFVDPIKYPLSIIFACLPLEIERRGDGVLIKRRRTIF